LDELAWECEAVGGQALAGARASAAGIRALWARTVGAVLVG
jgi:hypothetical protein